jgi:ADP-heptose:LPS heptosyltransferase
MKVLCVCPIGVGNYLLCYPAFSFLKKAMPDASMHLLALREGIAELARGDSMWDDITVFDPTKLRKNITAAVRIMLRLRSQRFYASLNFFPSNTWQYHLLPWLAGIKRRYAFAYHVADISRLSFLCNHVTPVDAEAHDVQQNYRLVASYFDNRVEGPPPRFPKLYSEPDAQWAQGYLASLTGNTVRIGIHPGSSADHGMDAKRWSPENFAGLADNVCGLVGGEALVFGGPDEDQLKIRVAAAMKIKAHAIPPVSLSKTAALLSQCAICICNDSGIMHMAACTGVPTAGIFGPTDEKRNGPYGEKTLVIRKKMEGFPVWTAGNVGRRSLPKGIDPQAPLAALTVDDAWSQLKPWVAQTLGLETNAGGKS